MDVDSEKLERTLERVEKMEALAERILAEARVSLMMSFRFLDRALWKMPYRSIRLLGSSSNTMVGPTAMLATDGHVLYYNARAVIGSFRANPDLVARTYLHAVLHCIFRHPFHTVRADVGLWSLACDICVESIALEMCHGRFRLPGDDKLAVLAPRMAELSGGLTPAKAYRALLIAKNEDACTREQLLVIAELNGHEEAFARDDHQLWDLVAPPQDSGQGQQPPVGGGGDGQADGAGDPDEDSDGLEDAQRGDVADDAPSRDSDTGPDAGTEPPDDEGDEDAGEGADGESGDETGEAVDDEGDAGAEDEGAPGPESDASPSPAQRELPAAPREEPEYAEGALAEPTEPAANDEDDWASIAQQVETELSTMQKERGEGAGTFMGNLALANRSRIDYADFLRRFATRAEDAKLSDDEFDYIFYTYGLRLYENMPLVEPLEYTESERIREFAIAIDTSGSCSQGLVNVFLARTYEILSRAQNLDEQVNIHIIQCDAEIQLDTVIHDMDELRAYERGFEVRGYGGTDFRPVFAYVDGLVATRQFTDLRGLVYFTDGYGVFPDTAPAYDVAFVFVEEEGKQRRVPPWAMKVVLDQDEIYEMESTREG